MLRNGIAAYLLCSVSAAKNGFNLFWGDTTSTVHNSRVCAWRSPHRTENSGYTLDISQDETLIRPFISRLLAWAWRLPRRRVFGFPNLFQYDSGLSARRGEVFAMKLPWRCAVYLFQGCD